MRDMKDLSRDFLKNILQIGKYLPEETPGVVADWFDQLDNQSLEVRNHYLEKMLDIYVATKVHRHLDGVIDLHTKLKEAGAIGIEKAINSGGDNWVCSLESRFWNHVLHFTTQNMEFIVLLRFGDDANKTRAEAIARYQGLEHEHRHEIEELVDKQFLPQFHIRKCKAKMADKLANRNIREHDSLKYGDCRDKDYVVSFKDFNNDQVDGAIAYYGVISYCLSIIGSHAADIEEWIR